MIRRWAVVAIVAAALPAVSGAQERWIYPRGEARANPLAPPAALYGGRLAPPLSVTAVMGARGAPLHAVVRLGEPLEERRVVRAGTRIGPYVVDRVQIDGLWVRLYVLGSPRRMWIPRAGLRSAAAGTSDRIR